MIGTDLKHLVQDYISKIVYDEWGSSCVVHDIDLELEYGPPFDPDVGRMVKQLFLTEGVFPHGDLRYKGLKNLQSKLGSAEGTSIIHFWSEDI